MNKKEMIPQTPKKSQACLQSLFLFPSRIQQVDPPPSGYHHIKSFSYAGLMGPALLCWLLGKELCVFIAPVTIIAYNLIIQI